MMPDPSLLCLKAAEARWASSALYACAEQLQQSGSQTLAVELFTAACDGAAFSLRQGHAQHLDAQVLLKPGAQQQY